MRYHAGLIGNGHTAALIEPDLTLSWLCIPRFDSQPLFASALDPRRGGNLSLTLELNGQQVSLTPLSQRYLGHSAVLQTELTGPGIHITATDFMPWGRHGIARRIQVQGAAGQAQLVIKSDPVRSAHLPVSQAVGLTHFAIQTPDGFALIQGQNLNLQTGEVAWVCIAWGATQQEAETNLKDLKTATVDDELAQWQAWLAPAKKPRQVPTKWEEAYWRSLIVIRLLSYEPTGALIAAPTASFPAIPGGDHQWDYRFTWMRDGYYTALTLDAAGLHREARRFYDFCFTHQEPDGHWKQPLYTVDGMEPHERLIGDLQGPGGEVPVRLGNAASGQLQLDNEGSIIHGLWFHYKTSGDLTALTTHWDGVRRAADWTAANWRRLESGIWEPREYVAHWVHGKVMCAVTLRAAARIAKALGHTQDAHRWQQTADIIAETAIQNGWDSERQSYVRHWGPTPETEAPMEISVLALVFYGLLPASDPRIRATIARMYRPADDGGLILYGGVCRYEKAAVPFYLPTLWLARYHLMAGEPEHCDQWLDVCLNAATGLGLMAEHFDGRDGAQWGNYPQAFSHEEVARLILERSQGWSFFDWEAIDPEPAI
ncbi:MAG: glycoside hydrolase 15-like protein [Symbiobacteriaceae bacterium]|nr:glycoside hydrolase 15-like protein [Symbiobacteriaceae bacterium]